MMPGKPQALRATLAWIARPASLETAEEALRVIDDGLLTIDGRGRIESVQPFDPAAVSDGVRVQDYRGQWLIPGLIDTHLHFPQVWCTDAYGGGDLLGWLERCVFPMEARLASLELARQAAGHFTRSLARSGTTTALIFGSQFPRAQQELFGALQQRGLRAIAGRTIMTEGPPSTATLRTDIETAVALVREEIATWHEMQHDPRARLGVALVPRFSMSLSRDALRELGEFYSEWRERGVWFTTHLSENDDGPNGEVQTVRRRFDVASYLDTYDGRFLPGSQPGGPSFLGPRSVFAHAVHCSDTELSRLAETGSKVAHCPISQQFLGSGLMPLRRVLEAGVSVGLGSDIGAGDEFCIARVANSAYKVHANGPGKLRLGPGALLHLATLGGAEALSLDAVLGTLEPGHEADLVRIDPNRDERLAARLELAGDPPAARLFSVLMSTRPELIAECLVAGTPVSRG